MISYSGTMAHLSFIDRLAPHIGKYEALVWLCGGLGCFTALGLLAVWNDKASKIFVYRSALHRCSLSDVLSLHRHSLSAVLRSEPHAGVSPLP
ncbi:NADH dehydrogenase [ubiquinone] 1 beta subcomplex subunit 8, mitochondrial-like [Carex rostrata]